MEIGIIGLGTVGWALAKWLETHTDHLIRGVDPAKKINDPLDKCEAIFICIPVRPSQYGQDTKVLEDVVAEAKKHTANVFIRSTVLPGTSDRLGCTAIPEFLTARRAHEDMEKLPILVGDCDIELVQYMFPEKEIVQVSNTEAELAKYAHNCFGALKVTYFNIIKETADRLGADFEKVKQGAFLTGFIEKEHTQVPGPDGKKGYGGACFPENVASLQGFYANKLKTPCYSQFFHFFSVIEAINYRLRGDASLVKDWEC